MTRQTYGGERRVVVSEEQRYGPRWLRDDDDDDSANYTILPVLIIRVTYDVIRHVTIRYPIPRCNFPQVLHCN